MKKLHLPPAPAAPAAPVLSSLATRLIPLLEDALDELGGHADEITLSLKLGAALKPRPHAAQVLEAVRSLEESGALIREPQGLRVRPRPPRMYSLFEEPGAEGQRQVTRLDPNKPRP